MLPLRTPGVISRSFSRAEADQTASPPQKIAIGTTALPIPRRTASSNRLFSSASR